MRVLAASVVTLALLCLGPATVMAQDEATPASEPAVYVSGTFENTVTEMPDPVPNPETGVLEVRNGHLEFVSEGGDPRLADPYVVDPINMDIDPRTGVGRMWGTGHYDGPDGGFEGAIWGLHYPVGEDVSGYTGSGWLTGSGAYEGLVYFYRGSFDGEEGVFEGIIFEGEAPPLE
jgi:hypothetical protein